MNQNISRLHDLPDGFREAALAACDPGAPYDDRQPTLPRAINSFSWSGPRRRMWHALHTRYYTLSCSDPLFGYSPVEAYPSAIPEEREQRVSVFDPTSYAGEYRYYTARTMPECIGTGEFERTYTRAVDPSVVRADVRETERVFDCPPPYDPSELYATREYAVSSDELERAWARLVAANARTTRGLRGYYTPT